MPNVLLTSSTPARRQQFFAALVALIFILVATVLAAIVARAVQTITLTADAIDDSRATAAAEGALQSMRKQLGATITDNAYWDDAYQQVNASDTNVEWITETWASITADYPLYDTAIVVDGDNKVVVAYRDGQDMGAKLSDVFGSRIDRLLEAAHSVSKTDAIPVHFIRTERGVELIGAATIQPSIIEEDADPKTLHVLVFAKHLTTAALADLSETFAIAGLTLDRAPAEGKLSVPLTDVSGDNVAYFNWPSEQPGTKSYLAVRGTIRAATVVLVLFLFAMGAVGFFTVARLQASEARSRSKAEHDALTGLLNRSGLIERMGRASEINTEEPAIMRLHFVDLDGFKGVNDAWGHAVGDELIVSVANRLSDTLSQDALIARTGGDEFAVVTIDPVTSIAFPRSVIKSRLPCKGCSNLAIAQSKSEPASGWRRLKRPP